MIAKIMKVHFDEPEGLSPDLEELLRSVLVSDPAARPSVQQLLAHPWASLALPPGMLQCNNKARPVVLSPPLPPPPPRPPIAHLLPAIGGHPHFAAAHGPGLRLRSRASHTTARNDSRCGKHRCLLMQHPCTEQSLAVSCCTLLSLKLLLCPACPLC